MKIQVGTIFLNKTRTYLSPSLKSYGTDFINKITDLDKLAIGVGDFIYFKHKNFIEQHIFILVDTNKDSFRKNLIWLKKHESYVDDYAYDDLHTGHLHMLVFKIPEQSTNAYHKFLESKYSEMYTKEEFLQYFNSKDKTDYNQERMKVLTKDHDYKIEFLDKINKEFNSDLTIEDLDSNAELETSIKRQEEYFNHDYE